MARNIAPGLGRKFAFENWEIISKDIIKSEKVKAYQSIDYEKEVKIFGYDIDKIAINIAKENAIKAGVEEDIIFEVKDAKNIDTDLKYGYIVSNPPYGERLLNEDSIFELYTMMGETYKKLGTWGKYIFTAHEEFERYYGKKSDKNRKLYNGKLKCYLYQYLGEKPPKPPKNHEE